MFRLSRHNIIQRDVQSAIPKAEQDKDRLSFYLIRTSNGLRTRTRKPTRNAKDPRSHVISFKMDKEKER